MHEDMRGSGFAVLIFDLSLPSSQYVFCVWLVRRKIVNG